MKRRPGVMLGNNFLAQLQRTIPVVGISTGRTFVEPFLCSSVAGCFSYNALRVTKNAICRGRISTRVLRFLYNMEVGRVKGIPP